MDAVSLCLSLTPHGRLVLTHETGAPSLDSGLADRLPRAFERGSGHGLLLLGADDAGTAQPPVYSYWREFGASYVTALRTQQDSDAPRKRVHLAAAVLYGIGARFDQQPELLFRLRAVNELELIGNAGRSAPLAKQASVAAKLLGDQDLSGMFGLDMAPSAKPAAGVAGRKPAAAKPKRAGKAAAASKAKRKPRKQAASTQSRKRAAGWRKPRRPPEIEPAAH